MGSAVLGEAIGAIRDWSVNKEAAVRGHVAFGSLVFNDAEQQKRLPKNVYSALRRTIVHAEPLDASVAAMASSSTWLTCTTGLMPALVSSAKRAGEAEASKKVRDISAAGPTAARRSLRA